MLQKDKEALQKFLLNLVEKPHALRRLHKDPRGFISKSALAKPHKQILLGNNVREIKDLVSGAVAGTEFAIQIVTDAAVAPVPTGTGGAPGGHGIHIHMVAAPGAPSDSSLDLAFHIVFGAEQPQVKVSLRPKASKPGQIETSVIHITTFPKP